VFQRKLSVRMTGQFDEPWSRKMVFGGFVVLAEFE
jgi:hypothetical protein